MYLTDIVVIPELINWIIIDIYFISFSPIPFQHINNPLIWIYVIIFLNIYWNHY